MIAAQFTRGIKEIIRRMGSDLNLVAPNNSSRPIRAVITSIGKEDAALINAYGIEARVLYLLTIDPPPKKFDRVTTLNNKTHVIQAVHDLLVDNAIVGHKCILDS